jgi:poly(A) polymerase
VKLGFRIHPDSEAPIFELAHLLADIPPARLFEEVLKLFHAGCALQGFEQLRHYGLFAYLFPQTERSLEREEHGFPLTFVARALQNTDERVRQGLPVTPAFLFAALLWEPLRMRAGVTTLDEVNAELLMPAAEEVIREQSRSIAFPRRFSLQARDIWLLQPRLEQRSGRRLAALLENPRFRAAYDFLVLRAESGEVDGEAADWWTRLQAAEGEERDSMTRNRGGNKKGRRRRSRRGGARKQATEAEPS